MKQKITPYLKKLCDKDSIALQYVASGEQPQEYSDPLMEDRHEVVKGLVHKYANRALIKVSYQCAAHCRFCTRIRQIGNAEGALNSENIAAIVAYLQAHPAIDDVILSGGDPFYTPQITVALLLKIKYIESVKVLRIGTRLPLQNPKSFESTSIKTLLKLITEIGAVKPFYILLHIEHPDELTPEAIMVIRQLRKCNVALLAQTVFLKNINDDYDTLHTLFQTLHYLGVIPYYLYHCDSVKGLEHFKGDLEKEKEMAVKLRANLSGIAMPLFVEDIENGYGKIPV